MAAPGGTGLDYHTRFLNCILVCKSDFVTVVYGGASLILRTLLGNSTPGCFLGDALPSPYGRRNTFDNCVHLVANGDSQTGDTVAHGVESRMTGSHNLAQGFAGVEDQPPDLEAALFGGLHDGFYYRAMGQSPSAPMSRSWKAATRT